MNPDRKLRKGAQLQAKSPSRGSAAFCAGASHDENRHPGVETNVGVKPIQDTLLDSPVAESASGTRRCVTRVDAAHSDAQPLTAPPTSPPQEAVPPMKTADQNDGRGGTPPDEDSSECALDESIIDSWISQYSGDVYRYLYWLSGNAVTAEDVTQETFLRTVKAFRGGSRPKDLNKAKAWLLTVARNEFLRTCQKQQPPQSNGLEHAVELPAPDEPTSLEEAEWLQDGLAKLNHDFRIVIVMHYFEQASYAEIAEALSIPIGTVMSRLNRARSQLKLLLNNAD